MVKISIKNRDIMTKKMYSDILLRPINPPDYKKDISLEEYAEIIVTRLGLKRKASRADHAKLLIELLKFKKEEIPIQIEEISKILGVSVSQAYEEIRKWRTLGLLEFVKMQKGNNYIKGYLLSAPTVNRLIDKVESSILSFLRSTRRIAKDFDDIFMLEFVRKEKGGE